MRNNDKYDIFQEAPIYIVAAWKVQLVLFSFPNELRSTKALQMMIHVIILVICPSRCWMFHGTRRTKL